MEAIVDIDTQKQTSIPNQLPQSPTLSPVQQLRTPLSKNQAEDFSTPKKENGKYLKLLKASQINFSVLAEKEMPQKLESIRKKPNELLIIHLNSRSVLNKTEYLQYIVEVTDADIICLSESWLDDSTPQNCTLVNGYNIIRKDRNEKFKEKYSKSHGGGVAILHKKQILIEKMNELNDEIEDILWTRVKAKPSFLLSVVYKPTYSDMIKCENGESILETSLEKAAAKSKNLIVVGDFNIDMSIKSKEKTSLNHIFKSYNLKQLIKKPTRIDPVTQKNKIIDHIWISDEMKELKSSNTTMGISDHLGVFLKLANKIKTKVPPKIKIRNYKKYNKENFSTEVGNLMKTSNFDELLSKNVNTSLKYLIDTITESAGRHAPFIEIKPKNEEKPAPWYTAELSALIRTKNELLLDSYLYGRKKFKKRIDQLQNKINKKKKSLKRKFTRIELEKAGNDATKLWKLLNTLTNRQNSHQSTEPSNMNQQKANEFNKFFATVGSKYQRHNFKEMESIISEQTKGSFSFKHETETSIIKIIDSLKLKTAVGIDGIGANLIKDLKTTIVPYLTKIINKAYDEQIFPDQLKKAIITPIFKEGDTDEISNYRPISVLTIICKIFERSASNQIVKYFLENQTINPHQHAYQPAHSTTTCLAEILNEIYSLLDQNQYVALAKLDLSKAFDSINHNLLIQKLCNLGLDKNSIKWISSYLENRSHITKFQNYTSIEHQAKTGVPQGSILGPLLFLCFINDLPNAFENICKMFGYADDTQLVITAPTLDGLKFKIEESILAAQKWYDGNNMKINPTKTEVIIFKSKRNTDPKIEIEVPQSKKKITPKPYIKILGVHIDNSLNFEKHINLLKRRTMNTTRNLHRINYLIPITKRLILYNALVSVQWNYCDVLYNGCNEKSKKSLQIVQNFAARSMTQNKKYESATQSLRQLNLLKLHQRRAIHESVFIHKIMLSKTPTNLYQQYQNYFMRSNTRAAEMGKMKIPTHRTSKFKKSPLYRTIKSWNDTPSYIPKDNIKKHKTILQNMMIKETYPL